MSLKITSQSIIVILMISSFCCKKLVSQNSNCFEAFPICSLSNYYFEGFTASSSPVSFFKECDTKGYPIIQTNSKWLKWEINTGGRIDFEIIPQDYENDIDFVLFKSDKKNCANLIATRLMLSGNNFENELSNCLGRSGLKQNANKIIESPGCNSGSTRFLKSIYTKPNEKYYLLINNYQSKQGFDFVLSGEAILKKTESCINQESKLKVSIYPNPANQVISIHFQNPNSSIYHYEVIDFLGHLIHKGKFQISNSFNQYKLNLNNLKPSNYFLKVYNSGQSHIIRFVKI